MRSSLRPRVNFFAFTVHTSMTKSLTSNLGTLQVSYESQPSLWLQHNFANQCIVGINLTHLAVSTLFDRASYQIYQFGGMDTPSVMRYECDPHGDVILVLRNPDTPFAVWEDVTAPNDDESAPTDNNPEPTSIESAERSNPSEDGLHEPRLIEMRASSRHLILASSYFNRMLNGDWKESNTFQSDGYLRIETSDLDIAAFQILMDIIHGRTRKVPRVVDLEMLAKIAVLVDFYQCLEVVEIWSTMWIDKLESSVPKIYSRDLVLWLCVSWVFQEPQVFYRVTRVATMQSTGPVQTLKLPIPERIIGKSL
jgi:hypothetical protein